METQEIIRKGEGENYNYAQIIVLLSFLRGIQMENLVL